MQLPKMLRFTNGSNTEFIQKDDGTETLKKLGDTSWSKECCVTFLRAAIFNPHLLDKIVDLLFEKISKEIKLATHIKYLITDPHSGITGLHTLISGSLKKIRGNLEKITGDVTWFGGNATRVKGDVSRCLTFDRDSSPETVREFIEECTERHEAELLRAACDPSYVPRRFDYEKVKEETRLIQLESERIAKSESLSIRSSVDLQALYKEMGHEYILINGHPVLAHTKTAQEFERARIATEKSVAFSPAQSPAK